jgi:rubrerythrin
MTALGVRLIYRIGSITGVEPFGNLIDRDELVKDIKGQTERDGRTLSDVIAKGVLEVFLDYIRNFPSVEPEIEKCEDCINRKDMIKKLNNLCNNICEYSKKQRKSMCDACNLSFVFDMINNAKSVKPERKTGKWIEGKKTPGYIKWNCSECGLLVRNPQKPWYEYCPKCGAPMEVDG